MERLSFKVTPYALEDTVRALTLKQTDYYNTVWVTKEDGDLMVVVERNYLNADGSTQCDWGKASGKATKYSGETKA